MAEEHSGPAQLPSPSSDFVNTLRNLLTFIDPPESVTIRDFEDREHHLTGVLPSRRQMKVFREILALIEHPVVQSLVRPVDPMPFAKALRLLLEALFSEELLVRVGEIFKLAHPDLFDDPLEALPLEEMLAGLTPFVMRFFQRTGMMLIGLGEQQA